MTTIQHAQKMIDKFYFNLYELSSNATPKEVIKQARRCAFICVDELQHDARGVDIAYWTEVKEEILKL